MKGYCIKTGAEIVLAEQVPLKLRRHDVVESPTWKLPGRFESCSSMLLFKDLLLFSFNFIDTFLERTFGWLIKTVGFALVYTHHQKQRHYCFRFGVDKMRSNCLQFKQCMRSKSVRGNSRKCLRKAETTCWQLRNTTRLHCGERFNSIMAWFGSCSRIPVVCTSLL